MGRTYIFECPKCGYQARVSGRADRGWHFVAQTILCLECKELYDAVTRFKVPVVSPLAEALARKRLKSLRETASRKTAARPPTFAVALNRLPPPGAKPFRWLSFLPACPVCPRHRIREWNQPDRCPKCGVLMEQNALPFRIWD
jgi:predicted RNA-binding Zn-ribbon protein involved in translation (DUF1610 family)